MLNHNIHMTWRLMLAHREELPFILSSEFLSALLSEYLIKWPHIDIRRCLSLIIQRHRLAQPKVSPPTHYFCPTHVLRHLSFTLPTLQLIIVTLL